jgi:hypothetical protein
MSKSTKEQIELPYPERSLNGNYPAAAVARFHGGFERDLVAWGATCSGNDRPDGTSYCNSTETFLDGGRPHCRIHLLRYCKHGQTYCANCKKTPDAPTIIPVTESRPVRPLERP